MKLRFVLLTGLSVLIVGAGSFFAYRLYHSTKTLNDTYLISVEHADTMLDTLSEFSDTPAITIFDYTPAPSAVSGTGDAASDETVLQELSSETGEITSPESVAKATEEITEAETAAGSGKYTPPAPNASHKIIFVGDSRTVGMGKAEVKLHNDECIYIGESGEGYNWFLDYGMDQLEDAIKADPTLPVVFNLGVNDCDAIASYIEVYRILEQEHPDTDFWYLSVNPVTEESPHVPNSDVLEFNEQLRSAFPDHYIDTCTWMMTDGFEDVDSVHYTEAQYCLIHDFAAEEIRKASPSIQ